MQRDSGSSIIEPKAQSRVRYKCSPCKGRCICIKKSRAGLQRDNGSSIIGLKAHPSLLPALFGASRGPRPSADGPVCQASHGHQAIRGSMDLPLAPNTSEASSNKRYNWICLASASRSHLLHSYYYYYSFKQAIGFVRSEHSATPQKIAY